MSKETLIRIGIPVVSLAWCVGVFFMGWKIVLWTIVGIAIGAIIKLLKENV